MINGGDHPVAGRGNRVDFILDNASHVRVCNDFAAFRNLDHESSPISWMRRASMVQSCVGEMVVTAANERVAGGSVHLYITSYLVEDSDYSILSQPKLVRDFGM